MADVTRLPNLRALIDDADFLACPYTGEDKCVVLIRDLFAAGGFCEPDILPAQLLPRIREVWWREESADPLVLVQPWDLWMCRKADPWVRHFGLVVDTQAFVHVAKAGVRLEPLRRWRAHLVQVGRLDVLW